MCYNLPARTEDKATLRSDLSAVVYYEEYDTKHEAMSREWHIKRMTREEKTELIAQQSKQS